MAKAAFSASFVWSGCSFSVDDSGVPLPMQSLCSMAPDLLTQRLPGALNKKFFGSIPNFRDQYDGISR
jgi:hypothetical protein